jgi:hypothetical protein
MKKGVSHSTAKKWQNTDKYSFIKKQSRGLYGFIKRPGSDKFGFLKRLDTDTHRGQGKGEI